MSQPRRIVYKLSGEMLGGPGGASVDAGRLAWIAGEIEAAKAAGPEIAIVVGAGNLVRGADLEPAGIGRCTADYMGMLGTAINALALGEMLAARGVPARVMSAIRMEPAVEAFDRGAALEALGGGEIVIFAAGTGNPCFTTDTAAALRAVEIGADLLAKATKVDGIFDKDPEVDADAEPFSRIAYDQVLSERLAVMDATAVAMCRDHRLPVLVFGLDTPGNLARVAAGETPGTLMS